ncbi:serine--tRNA ligase [bacterium]|nr:serine--tRNA ligase [bacterium]|tara:strand:+ start:6407 stop:7663 length:1257 start_codon:yes stop_codon:yes gene_type:complete
MLDIKFIRENKDLVQAGAQKKHLSFDVKELLKVDDERVELLKKVEEKRAEQNKVTEEIAKLSGEEREKKIKEMKAFKDDFQKDEEKLKNVMGKWRDLMLQVPNIPDVSVPEGKTDEENKELKKVGEIPKFSFTPKNHIELATQLSLADFERGSKAHGFRGYYLKNDGALLSWAIWNYAQEFFLKKEFTPFIAPSIVKKEYFYGTGHLPNEAEDLYVTQDDDYLSGTAEVPMMAYHAGETLDKKQLPLKYLAFSPCYRREAGSYGKDTKGLVRVHEFFKLEQVVLCEASHEESVKWHEWLNANTEEFITSLGLPYRVVTNCGGDLGLGQVKKYDIELWVPSEEKYREISSASYFHDFQSRRFNIRYNDEGGKQYAHSLNSTAIPTPRILVSLLENNQQEDGSIRVPEVLQKYLGKDVIK